MSQQDEKKFLNSLLLVPGVGYETAARIKHTFSSYEEAWHARTTSGFLAAGISEKVARAIERAKTQCDPDREMERLEKAGVLLMTAHEPDFPQCLKEIAAPPQWLYIKGRMPAEKAAIAVVGSRKATSYGREATERIIAGLSEMTDVVIVSGLAIGVDGEAHRSALKHCVQTIAVVGSGIDRQSLYPPQHVRLADEIAEKGGAIISEYPLGMPAFKQNFVQRNRIISGLSRGTIIVEAGEKSGTLITARFALEQGREVFAVPGSIFSPYSAGTNTLIAEGATPALSAEYIVNELGLPTKSGRNPKAAALTDEKEKNILENLDEPRNVDELKALLGTHTSDIVSSLSMLELKGLIKNMQGVWVKI